MRLRLLFLSLLWIAAVGCGVDKVNGTMVDKKCGRDIWELWKGVSCPKSDESSESVVTVPEIIDQRCRSGLNNTQCEIQLVEESVWESKTFSYLNAIKLKVTYQSFYRLYPDSQTWEHYLFVRIPYRDKLLMEKRTGTFTIARSDFIEYIAATKVFSSCEGKNSLFKIFDHNRNAVIGRLGNKADLAIPADVTAGMGMDTDENVRDFFKGMVAWVLDLTFAPLSSSFWQSVVTGAYFYEESTVQNLQELLDGSDETCLSNENLVKLQDSIDIPPEVKFVLENLQK